MKEINNIEYTMTVIITNSKDGKWNGTYYHTISNKILYWLVEKLIKIQYYLDDKRRIKMKNHFKPFRDIDARNPSRPNVNIKIAEDFRFMRNPENAGYGYYNNNDWENHY